MNKVIDLFEVEYGNSLEFDKLRKKNDGINFVSRTAKNNGVSGRVEEIDGIRPFPANIITVSLGGSVMEAFLQPEPFYTSYHIYCLSPKVSMSIQQKLFYCLCLRANKYRYNYGRQANRTLRDLEIPSIEEIPNWVNEFHVEENNDAKLPLDGKKIALDIKSWQSYSLDKLFTIKKGKRLTKANMKKGNLPFIGSINRNNGISNFVGQKPIHQGNTISVNYNGSVGQAFYQPVPFWACDDVNVLYPKFKMNQYIGLFIATVIMQEKFRYNYGRKWHLIRMRESKIRLPANPKGEPDFEYMEQYIKSLPYSSTI